MKLIASNQSEGISLKILKNDSEDKPSNANESTPTTVNSNEPINASSEPINSNTSSNSSLSPFLEYNVVTPEIAETVDPLTAQFITQFVHGQLLTELIVCEIRIEIRIFFLSLFRFFFFLLISFLIARCESEKVSSLRREN
jgi:hypothetical protein